jgi:hypothetical protein
MSQLGRALIVLGSILALIGGVIVVASKLGLGRMPGDIVIERRNIRVYFPVVTSIVVSIVLTILANLLLRRR